ncbi:MAG TPA: VIT1/CCC1 transporter family protein [Thiobacillaceae bacterium]|nr:VIT1/CCC1 transporter family protein [Thiobacillaceae bacterium]
MQPLENWREEKRSAWLYRIVSDAESGTPRQVLFLELARAAERQAEAWADALRRDGRHVPAIWRPDPRTRLIGWLVPRLGVGTMKGILAAMKVRGMSLYRGPRPHGIPMRLEQIDAGQQRAQDGNNLRAAVFGVNDGLVSNASLILGVAGAGVDARVVLLSGLAGLLAGAFSMAAGEYVSVRSQREFHEYQMALERQELDQYPQEEAAELALIYAAKGMDAAQARQLADRLLQDPDRALDTLAREELGLNPDALGSPWGAAASSFLAFALGAGLPVLPYLLLGRAHALGGVVAVTGIALFGVGASLSLFTGRPALSGGLRMLLIGGAAGASTWAIGRALGMALG